MRKLLIAGLLAAVHLAALAQDGQVRIGMVAGLSGPIAETTQEVLKVVEGYIRYVNEQGGVNGNRISLAIRDDQYNPGKTAALMEDAIVKDKVVGLINAAGTAQTIGVIRAGTLKKHGVPLVGVFSGAAAIRGPGSEEIFHTRVTYHDEVMKIGRLSSTLGLQRIAVLYQDDAFGQGIMKSVEAAEAEYKLSVVLKSAYKPGNTDFGQHARDIVAARPQAIFLLGVPDATYRFMKVYDAPAGAAQIFTLSFVTPTLLAAIAGESRARGVGITQVVPNPNSTSLPLMKDFQTFLKSPHGQGIQPSAVAAESYLNLRVMLEAIRKSGPQPTSDKVMRNLIAMQDSRLGGFRIDYSQSKRNGSDYLDIAVVGRNAVLLH